MTTNLILPDPATELGAALEVALAACDEADAIAMASFRQAIDVDGQAGRLVRDGGRHGHRAGHPGAHQRPASRSTAWSARSTASSASAAGALDHRPHRRHPQLHARRAPLRDAAGPRGRRRAGAGRRQRSGPASSLVRVAGRRRLGGDAGTRRLGARRRPCPSGVSGVARLRRPRRWSTRRCPASRPAAWRRASSTSWAWSGATAAWATSMATCWSRRAPRRSWSRPS